MVLLPNEINDKNPSSRYIILKLHQTPKKETPIFIKRKR